MKKQLILWVISFIAFIPVLTAQKDVKIIGHLVNQNDVKLKNACVYLYTGNTLVDSVITKKKGKFTFHLAKDNLYTVEMTANDYAPKKISINTYMPAGDKLYDDFEFIMEMIPMVSGVDYSELDFPVALIEYSEKKHEMIFVSSYAKAMKIEQKKIAQEVKMAQKNN